jgi:putative RNA 2'-phosphotransferase
LLRNISVESILKHLSISYKQLTKIVEKDNKNRFGLKDGYIRANQGHSLKVDLNLEKKTPPAVLYHGTVEEFIPSIKKDGLQKMKRHAVHLYSDLDVAKQVASRRKSKSVILEIDCFAMQDFDFLYF